MEKYTKYRRMFIYWAYCKHIDIIYSNILLYVQVWSLAVTDTMYVRR